MTQSRQSQVSLFDTPYYGLNRWTSTLSFSFTIESVNMEQP